MLHTPIADLLRPNLLASRLRTSPPKKWHQEYRTKYVHQDFPETRTRRDQDKSLESQDRDES